MDWEGQLERTDAPRGIFQGRVGSTGRMKLPAQVFRYLVQVGDKQDPVFVTTLDRKTVRIFSVPGWKRQSHLLDTAADRSPGRAVPTREVICGNSIDDIETAADDQPIAGNLVLRKHREEGWAEQLPAGFYRSEHRRERAISNADPARAGGDP